MKEKFEAEVKESVIEYRRKRYSKPKYIIINRNTIELIKDDIYIKSYFGLLKKKIYKGLYIAIDNELDDYQFVIVG